MEHFESSPSAPHANGEGEPIGAPAQRRSGRAVKKPEFFAPNSQGERGSRRGKRKRVEEGDGDDEDPDDDTSDGDSPPSAADESGNESDGVRRRRARKATATKRAPKAAAAKRARTGTGRTSTLPLRTVTTKPASKPRKAGRKARAASAASADSDGIYGKSGTLPSREAAETDCFLCRRCLLPRVGSTGGCFGMGLAVPAGQRRGSTGSGEFRLEGLRLLSRDHGARCRGPGQCHRESERPTRRISSASRHRLSLDISRQANAPFPSRARGLLPCFDGIGTFEVGSLRRSRHV